MNLLQYGWDLTYLRLLPAPAVFFGKRERAYVRRAGEGDLPICMQLRLRVLNFLAKDMSKYQV